MEKGEASGGDGGHECYNLHRQCFSSLRRSYGCQRWQDFGSWELLYHSGYIRASLSFPPLVMHALFLFGEMICYP
jgi:hypothetical protein